MKADKAFSRGDLPNWARWLGPLRPWLNDPRLWCSNRESVARGMSLGLFIGLLVPLGQTPLAALLTIPMRAHLLTAAGATLVTNPFTIPVIYFAALRTGEFLLSESGSGPKAETSGGQADVGLLPWLVSLSGPIALGLVCFAILGALAGYVGVKLSWRLWVTRRWVTRGAHRAPYAAEGPAPLPSEDGTRQ